jgi:hypothetical protein
MVKEQGRMKEKEQGTQEIKDITPQAKRDA